MKRKIPAVVLMLFICFSAFAASVSATDRHVFDNAMLLAESRVNKLERYCNMTEEEYGCTPVIYTYSVPEENAAATAAAQAGLTGDDNYVVLCVYDGDGGADIGLDMGGGCEIPESALEILKDNAEGVFNTDGIYTGCKITELNIRNVLAGREIVPGNKAHNFAVSDGADYFTPDQEAHIAQRLDALREKYGIDAAVVTDAQSFSGTAMDMADDIFDSGLYGCGENDNGILLYINSATRDYWITTSGSGETVFNDRGIDYINRSMITYLKDGDMYSAAEVFADKTDELMSMAASGKPYDKKPPKALFFPILICIGMPLLIAFSSMKRKLKTMDTAVKANFAANYMSDDGIALSNSNDIFMYSNVARTARAQQSGGRSGGGHVSSSGSHHGGGGGKF